MSQIRAFGALAVLALGLMATAAVAHPKLKSTVPAADTDANASSTQNGPTKEIRLTFSEAVIAKMSGIELKDETGKTVPTGSSQTDPKDQKQLVVPVSAPLVPGHYSVTWHAVSEDTHRVKGAYNFSVGR